MFHEREPFVQPAEAVSLRRTRPHHGSDAQLIDQDEDVSADRILIDPLDDRDSRCALRGRRQ